MLKFFNKKSYKKLWWYFFMYFINVKAENGINEFFKREIKWDYYIIYNIVQLM